MAAKQWHPIERLQFKSGRLFVRFNEYITDADKLERIIRHFSKDVATVLKPTDREQDLSRLSPDSAGQQEWVERRRLHFLGWVLGGYILIGIFALIASKDSESWSHIELAWKYGTLPALIVSGAYLWFARRLKKESRLHLLTFVYLALYALSLWGATAGWIYAVSWVSQ